MRRAWALGLLVAVVGAVSAVFGLAQPSPTKAKGRADARKQEPGSSRTSPATAGTWFVPASGAQVSAPVENRQAGTRRWRLPGPAADVGGLAYGSVAGYVSAPAALPGHTERVYVAAPHSRWIKIALFRIGWYHGAGGREVFASARLPARGQPSCSHQRQTGLTQCNWHPTLTLHLPSSLASGVYIVKLTTDNGASDCMFVVESVQPQPILAQLPTATYEAYNAWGGDSLYSGGNDTVGLTGTTQGVEVSYDRPYDSVTGAGQFFARDIAMVWFLERAGYPVSYTTSESVASHPEQLSGHRALLDFGHSEYWSQHQEAGWANALKAGTSLLFFGSDTLAWRVRYEAATTGSSEAGNAGHVIVAYKEHAVRDPHRADPTGIFPDRGARLDGSAYLGCITPRIAQPGPPTYRYYAWSPEPTLKPSWLFAGTGVTATTEIRGIVGYELDQRTPFTPAGTHLVGYGVAPCGRRAVDEPGEPVARAGDDLAETTLYTAPSGALVFDTGTLGWELGLEPVPSSSPDAPRTPDRRLVAMTRNLIDHALGLHAGPRGR